MFFLSYPYSRLAIDYESNLSTLYRTLADISKTMKRRRSRRERKEKKVGTCAHVKTIEFGRKERKHNRKETHARVRTMKLKREDGHRIRRPAQKPTPTSPTHGSHPKETKIINFVYLFPNIRKITQPFARKYLQAIGYRYITSIADPGPTVWKLLLLETRELTGTLLFTTTLLSRKQSNGATSTPDEFKPPNAKIAAPCVSTFGNRLTHSSTIQHRKLRSSLEHNRSCFRDKRRNPKLNPTVLADTYASIPETLT
ncbi:hypothetical protein V1477_017663 [Vespula maculifrons]|uniref:Uncharacterized protein n=1 Tax=Vespula maculifrons TaxID=7453 RepID=A0ABD2B6Q0_VESMC